MTTEFDVLHKAISNAVTVHELWAVYRIVMMVKMAGQLISNEINQLETAYTSRYFALMK
jgi:hypothetical protein